MMSNETKRDVFDELLEIAGNAMDQAMSAQYPSDENGCAPSGIGKAIRDILDPIEKRYDAALPDDLPVIPQTVGEILRSAHGQTNLLGVLDTAKNGYKVSDPLAWIIASQNTFAIAWVLGVWKVEETGEIVKLEEEK